MNLYLCFIIANTNLDLFGTFVLGGEKIRLDAMKGSHVGKWEFKLRDQKDWKNELGMLSFIWTKPYDEVRTLLNTTESIGFVDIKFENSQNLRVPMYYCTASTGRPMFQSKPSTQAKMPFFGV